ncbi:hypothetical protein E4T56_gene13561 [Termitomyces sp. T112]|nr:hypothetical protein E4T56_gene13561 [Termitomyces sp. T112]
MFLSSLLLLALAPLVSAAPEVTLGQTTLVGRDISGLKQDFFGGIPFAEPPIGNLRLEPPVLKLQPTNNKSDFDATNFGPSCFQAASLTLQPLVGLLEQGPMSEDCLTINVFRPSGTKPNAKLPVVSSFSALLPILATRSHSLLKLFWT